MNRNNEFNADSNDVWRLLCAYPKELYSSLILSLVASILSFSPYLGGYLLLTGVFSAPAETPWAGILAGSAAGTALGRVLHGYSLYFSHRLAFAVQESLRLRCGALLLAVPVAFFSHHAGALLRDLIQEDIETLEDGIAHLVPEVAQVYGTPLFLFGVMFWLDWRMALTSIGTLVLGAALFVLLVGKGEETIRAYHRRQREMSAAISEVVACMPLVRVYNQGDRALFRAKEACQGYFDDAAAWMTRMAIPEGLFQALISANLVFVLPLGLVLYHQASLTFASLAFFLLFSLGLAGVLGKTAGIAHRFTLQQQLLGRIFSLLATPGQRWVQASLAEPQDYSVTFDNVCFSYDQRQILTNVDIHVPAGKSLALVGASGAGKSTLARLLPRFYDVTSGTVRIGGVDVRKLSARRLYSLVSCVFQDTWLFNASVSDNLRIARPDASEAQIETAARAAQAHEFICALPQGYHTLLGDNGQSLSGGQRQRLAIARALLKDAPILVLDEATSCADAENELYIQQAIGRLSAGKTVIIIAHRLYTLTQADNIVVLHEGCVRENGAHRQLVASDGLYQRWWRLQQGGGAFDINGGGSSQSRETSR